MKEKVLWLMVVGALMLALSVVGGIYTVITEWSCLQDQSLIRPSLARQELRQTSWLDSCDRSAEAAVEKNRDLTQADSTAYRNDRGSSNYARR